MTTATSERPATDADYNALYDLHVASMKDYVSATYGWDDAVQLEMFRGNWAEILPELRVVIADGNIVAAYRALDRAEEVYLASIEVHPEHQGNGIGKRIVQKLLDEATQKKKPVALFVMKANPRARRLYERLGFSVVAETQTHFAMASRL